MNGFDYYSENPYKRDEAKFNSDKYRGSSSSERNILFKTLESLELF